MRTLSIYIASSFRHIHAVRLFCRELDALGYEILDWTEKARPPQGLNSMERRIWMDTDHGGAVYKFCATACNTADLLIYMGESGQDAGVETGMARAFGIPSLGIRGPLEAPGLMLYGAVDVWVESVDMALNILSALPKDFAQKMANNKAGSKKEEQKNLLRKSLQILAEKYKDQ